MLAQIDEGEFQARVMPELMQSVIEITTPVCRTPGRGRPAAAQLRRYVAELARADGCRFASAGTHPFSLFERQRITAKDRYRKLVDQMQYLARRELIFGMHVHAAVDDPEKAIQVANGLLIHLPEFLALSASSPFWRGEPTGLASSRQMVFSAFPRSGVPPRFESYEAFAELVGQLERTGCIADYTHIWWDIRLHPRLGTVELRICDAVTRVEDAVALAAYYQALVKMLSEHVESVGTPPSFHRILTTENKWLAARHGLAAPVMDLVTGPAEPRADRAARSAARSATSSRTRASSAPSASSRGSPRSSPAATAPRSSCASGTRTATSPRSCTSSPTRREVPARPSSTGGRARRTRRAGRCRSRRPCSGARSASRIGGSRFTVASRAAPAPPRAPVTPPPAFRSARTRAVRSSCRRSASGSSRWSSTASAPDSV